MLKEIEIMKKILFVLVFVMIPVIHATCDFRREMTEEEKAFLEEQRWKESWEGQWDDLLYAMIEVESHGNPRALGKANDRGILQITPILVREVNRLSDIKYTHDDAWDEEKSKEMFYIIARHYCPDHDFEKMARIWNGGPQGHHKSCTQGYWTKVQREMSI